MCHYDYDYIFIWMCVHKYILSSNHTNLVEEKPDLLRVPIHVQIKFITSSHSSPLLSWCPDMMFLFPNNFLKNMTLWGKITFRAGNHNIGSGAQPWRVYNSIQFNSRQLNSTFRCTEKGICYSWTGKLDFLDEVIMLLAILLGNGSSGF